MKPLFAPFVAFLWSNPEKLVLDAQMARLDGDDDGTLTPAELAQTSDGVAFGAIDTDGDGLIDAEELGAWLRATPPRPVGGHRAGVVDGGGLDLPRALLIGVGGGLIAGIGAGMGLERLRRKR